MLVFRILVKMVDRVFSMSRQARFAVPVHLDTQAALVTLVRKAT